MSLRSLFRAPRLLPRPARPSIVGDQPLVSRIPILPCKFRFNFLMEVVCQPARRIRAYEQVNDCLGKGRHIVNFYRSSCEPVPDLLALLRGPLCIEQAVAQLPP